MVVTDGSGSITIRNAGSVVVRSDGSGSIDVSGVRGDVVVRDDGSAGCGKSLVTLAPHR